MGKTKGAVTLQKKKTPVIIYLLLYVFALYGAIMIADIWDPELNLYDQLVNIMNHMSVNPLHGTGIRLLPIEQFCSGLF